MVFSSLLFLFFFAAVLALHNLPLPWIVKKVNLLLASYLFYAGWNPPFVAVLWLTTVVDWWVARRIAASESGVARRLLLGVSLSANLGLLAFFKYGAFLTESLAAVAGDWLSPVAAGAAWSIVLPVGISFYTFVTLSYTIDVYRGDLRPCDSLLDFALLVSFFPHLVAGPILRASEFLPQCRTPRTGTSQQVGWGLTLFILGTFEKVVLADGILAPVVERVYGALERAGQGEAWVAVLAFSGQIFYDFAGYSLCAIGLALALGFAFPDNFRCPYAAIGFSDFWHRWHLTLSRWLRDYLYIPLGGNRKGRARTALNLLLTMLLGGLWHGAAWRFVLWGGLHGAYLMGEQGARQFVPDRLRRGVPPVLVALGTFAAVSVTWVLFRATTLGGAGTLLAKLVSPSPNGLNLGYYAHGSVLLVVALLVAGHWWLRDTSLEEFAGRLRWWGLAGVLAAMLILTVLAPGEDRAFIYFQF
jgi:alginate O-acetyltransferase complex protein AlgI